MDESERPTQVIIPISVTFRSRLSIVKYLSVPNFLFRLYWHAYSLKRKEPKEEYLQFDWKESSNQSINIERSVTGRERSSRRFRKKRPIPEKNAPRLSGLRCVHLIDTSSLSFTSNARVLPNAIACAAIVVEFQARADQRLHGGHSRHESQQRW